MSPNPILVAIGSGLLLLPALCTAQGNLLVNGTFTFSASGWTLSNGSFYSSGGGYVILDALSPSASTDPGISQTVAGLVPGLSYAVSGQYALAKDRGNGSYTNTSFGVSIGGSLMFEAMAPSNSSWQAFAFPFTATSSSAVLALFAQINGTGQSYSIDNLVLQPIPFLASSPLGTNLLLRWSTNAVGFALQSSSNLSVPSSWVNVTNSVVVAGSNRAVTVSGARPCQYFRLKL